MRYKLSILSLACFMTLFFSGCNSTENNSNTTQNRDVEITHKVSYTKLNKLIKANWSNMKTWVYLYDPLIDDFNKSNIIQIGIGKEERNTDKVLKNLVSFVKLINQKHDNNIKALGYEKDNNNLIVIYEDETSIIWNFENGSIGGNDIQPEKTLETFSNVLKKETLDDLRLTIYYIKPSIFTRAPLSVDDLISHSAVNKIVIDSTGLKEHIDLLKQINVDALISVKQKSRLNARLCYVFETDKDGKMLEVAMGGDNISVFVNGFEVENNDVFYDIIKPFLTEVKELEIYFNRG